MKVKNMRHKFLCLAVASAMAIALFWYMTKQMEIHKQETAELRDVISENNEILAGLKQLIEDRLNG